MFRLIILSPRGAGGGLVYSCSFACFVVGKEKVAEIFVYFSTSLYLCQQIIDNSMTSLQANAEFFRALGEIADDETLMSKAVKYVKKLASEKKKDPSLMTKEEFFRRVDEAKKGPSYRMNPDEDVTTFLNRISHEL